LEIQVLSRAKAPLRKRQKREGPPGAETAEIEGWTAFAWKHNALRHSFISSRVAQVQDVAKVSLEAGNSPRMVFSNYREIVRPADAEKWIGITPEVVEPARKLGGALPALKARCFGEACNTIFPKVYSASW
jgi:hypothetical protein